MSSQNKMTVQGAFIMMVTMIAASCRGAGAVVVHAAVDLGGDHSEFLQALLKQLDTLVSVDQRDSKAISQVSSEVAGSLLQSAPSVTIRGNITDHERRLTLTFTVHAARTANSNSPAALQEVDDDDDEEDDEWRSSSGVLSPIVDAVEPYILGFMELVFNGILSTVISNFLEGSNLLGDVRLV